MPDARDVRERGGPLRAGSTSRRSSPSCARTAARSRPPPDGRLPRLVTRSDLIGDCHSHSDWSDGRTPLERMVETARAMGQQWLVLTDHSWSLTIANGLAPDRVEQQRRLIGELNERFAREVAQGTAPEGAHPRLPAPARLRARDHGRRSPRLRGRAARAVRRRRRVAPRRATPAARAADGALRGRAPQPARRHHRPPVGPEDRSASRPRPRLGCLLSARRRDRHVPRDQRLRGAPRPRRGAHPRRARGRLPLHDRLGRPRPDRVAAPRLGHDDRAARLDRARPRRQHAPARGLPRRSSRSAAGTG